MTAKKETKSEKPSKGADAGESAVSQLPIGKAPKETFSLHLKGPKWIKDRDNAASKLKELNARIKNVRHPRQKSTDYVFVDFDSAEERDEAYKELLPLKDVHVQLARKDNPELVEMRKAKVQAKREAKQQLKQLMKNIAKNEQREKQAEKPKKLSNQIVILNLPKVTTQTELNEHFDLVAAELNLDKNPKRKFSRAILTLATPKEAINATKKELTLHGVKLTIRIHKNLGEVQKMKRVEIAKKRKLIKGVEKGTEGSVGEASEEATEDATEEEDASDEPKAKRPLVLAPERLNAGKKTAIAKKAAKAAKKPLVKASNPKKASPAKKVVKAKKQQK